MTWCGGTDFLYKWNGVGILPTPGMECLLFTYVNDMPNVVSSDLHMFADDTKLYRTISYIHLSQIVILYNKS